MTSLKKDLFEHFSKIAEAQRVVTLFREAHFGLQLGIGGTCKDKTGLAVGPQAWLAWALAFGSTGLCFLRTGISEDEHQELLHVPSFTQGDVLFRYG